jgi:molecular chaperone GrpE
MVDEKEMPSNDNLEQLLDSERKRSEDYLTRLKYLQADLENFKNRTAREAEQVKNYCTERFVIQLLDVVDELELAVKNGEISTSPDSLIEGVEMTMKKFRKVLEQEGVTHRTRPQVNVFSMERQR